MSDLNLIADAIRDYLGERCSDFDPGCLCCRAWAEYDEITALRAENERLRAANETWAGAYHAEYYANERLRAALREVMDDLTLISKNHWLPVGLLDDVIYVNARAALDGQPAPSGWRPIDQPPSHPMRVLLFSPEQYDANWSGADYGMRVAYYANGQWRDQGTNHDAFEFDAPTHWMPLPPAPGKEGR